MAIFICADHESEVQTKDMTRIDCSKSFAVRGSTAISTLTVTPGVGESAVSIYNSDSDLWYLDWMWLTQTFDVGSGNNDIKFEVGGTEYTGTIASGNYATLALYATALAAAMQSAYSNSFAASVSNSKITITGTTAFEFKDSSGVSQAFLTPDVGSTSHTGKLVEYGTRKVTVAAGNGTDTDSRELYINVYSETGDHLYCTDQDIAAHESDILKWVSPGRATFKNVFRRVQKLIVAWLDEKGYVNAYGVKYSKNDVVDIEEVRQWAIFMSLRIIFESITNAVDDVFAQKAKRYEALEIAARQRVILRLDYDQDGEADVTEGVSIYSGGLFRR